MTDDAPILCTSLPKDTRSRPRRILQVTIEAVADPTPPSFSGDELARDYRRDWREVVAALKDTSPQEALDQVYRRVVIHLCNACYRDWIENPAG